jgi:RNA-binding protein YhbY
MLKFSDRDFKAAIITVIHETKVKILAMNGKKVVLYRETESI